MSLSTLLASLPQVVAIRGRVGDCVFKTYGRRIILTRVPRFDGYAPSGAQRRQRERMRAATAYAQNVYAHPVARAFYAAAAGAVGRKPFRLAVADFLAADNPDAAARRARALRMMQGAAPRIAAPPASNDTAAAAPSLSVRLQTSGSAEDVTALLSVRGKPVEGEGILLAPYEGALPNPGRATVCSARKLCGRTSQSADRCIPSAQTCENPVGVRHRKLSRGQARADRRTGLNRTNGASSSPQYPGARPWFLARPASFVS